jgi:hypothetical protein
MNYDVTINSVVSKIKQVIKPCFRCGESLNVTLRFEEGKDREWLLIIGCPNSCMPTVDKRLETIGAVEVELLQLLDICE